MTQLIRAAAAATFLFVCGTVSAANERGWVEQSNEHAQVVLEVMAEFNPEGAARLGIDGLDEAIIDFRPGFYERSRSASEAALAELRERLATESDARVRQDLEIMIQATENRLRSSQLRREHLLPYFNVSQTVFQGVRALVDPQVPRERYPAAIVRMQKYAGLQRAEKPLTELAKDRTRERFDVEGLVGPYRGQVMQDLERSEAMISGIGELLAGTELEGWRETYEVLAGQLRGYNDWLKAEILPRARDDYRLPLELYEDALRNWGVDADPLDLIEQATKGYMDIRNEMEALAQLVAKEKGYETSDYREVIALLKRDGALDGDKLLDHYYEVLREIEAIIEREDLVTLPERDAGIRIATEAESAVMPAPHLDIPRLLGNTGEYPFFVIPQLQRDEDGSWRQTDDSYLAGSWTLTAHEARPGHELQFSSIIESGASTARALFAFNSANIEGWGLYAEAIVRPSLPIEAQLISLQYRLIRAGRMFLDPMLNLGMITPDEALRLIVDDMAVGKAWAEHEIERYTYRIPGQATAYYYGYSKMQALRAQTELRLRDRFDQRAFHDFVLAQGLLPPDILKEAVMTEFVPAQRKL